MGNARKNVSYGLRLGGKLIKQSTDKVEVEEFRMLFRRWARKRIEWVVKKPGEQWILYSP